MFDEVQTHYRDKLTNLNASFSFEFHGLRSSLFISLRHETYIFTTERNSNVFAWSGTSLELYQIRYTTGITH